MTKLNFKFALILAGSVIALVLIVYFVHGWQIQRNAYALVNRFESFRQDGDLTAAKRVLKQYLRLQPDSREQRIKLSKVAYELATRSEATREDLVDAWQLMEDTVRRHPDALEVRKDLVEFLVRHEMLSQAIDHLRIVLNSQTQNTEERSQAQFALARCQLRAGETKSRDEAIQTLQELVGYDPKSDRFDIKKARYPREPEAYDLLISEYRRDTAQAKLADRIADQMVTANPNSHEAYLRRASHLLNTNRLEPARADIDKARRLNPDDLNVTLIAARVMRLDGKPDEADKLYDEAMRKHPKHSGAYQERVQLLLMVGNVEKARQLLDEGLKAVPDDLGLQWQKCRLFIQTNDREKAHSLLDNLRQRLPAELIEPLSAQLLMAEGNVVDAARRIEAIRPRLTSILPRLAQTSFGRISFDLLPQTLLTLNQCYAQMGQLDRQQQALEALLDLNPKFVDGLLQLANIHLALGREDEAAAIVDSQVRKSLEGDRFWKSPAAYSLKLDIENRRQLRQPESKRNWRRVDQLLDLITQNSAATINPLGLVLLNIQNQLVREKPDQARKLIDAELKKHNATQLDDSTRQPLLALALADCGLVAHEKSPADALARLDDIQAKFGDSPTIRQRRALLLVQRGGPTVAQELAKLEENLSEREQIPTWKMLAGYYEAIRSPDDARRLYEQVLKQQPHDLPTYMALFELAYRADDDPRMTEVIKDIERLCGRESAERSYLEAKRLMRLAAKSEDTAVDLNDKARSLLKQVHDASNGPGQRPKWHLPVRLLAEIAFREDDIATGLKLMEESLRLGPADAQSVSILVQLYGRQGDLAGARRAIERLRENERTPDLRKVAAQLELIASDKEQGRREALRQAAEIMSDLEKGNVSSSDYLWHANLLNQCGKPKEAAAAYRKAVARNPQDESAWMTFVHHLAAQREIIQATDVIREAELALPEDRLPYVAAECFKTIGKLDSAERLYLELLRGAPESTMLLRAMTEIQMQKNDARAMFRYLDRLVALADKKPPQEPNIAWARRAKANVLAKTNDYANFKRACELIQSNYVDGKPSLVDLAMEAEILANRREKEYVDKAIEKIAAIRKDRGVLPVGIQFALASLYNQSGDWDKCQEELRSLYPRTKQNPQLLAAAVDLFLDHNELSNAESRLEDLRSLQASTFDYIRRQARFLALAGKPQEAVGLLSRLVPAGPDAALTDEQVAAIRAVGLELEHIKQYDAAEKLIRRAAAARTVDHLTLAGFLARRGGQKRIQEAIDISDGELKRDVRYELILQVAAEAIRPGVDKPRPTDKQIEQMAAWYEKAEKSDLTSVHFKLRKAEFLDLRGLHSDAAAVYRELLGRPDLEKNERGLVLNNLAFLLVVSDGNLDEALQHIDESIDILGPSSDLRDTRGLIHLRRGDNEQAMRDMHLAVQGGASASKYLHRALVYQQGKNFEAAAKDLKEALKLRLNKDDLTVKEREWYDQLQSELKRNGVSFPVNAIDAPAKPSSTTR